MTINLKQLTGLFAQSAGNEELPVPIRQFAAQLTVLTAHVGREAQAKRVLEKRLDDQIAELATFMSALPIAPTTAAAQPTPVIDTEITTSENDEDDEAKAMAEQIQRETEAEVAAIAAKTPVEKPRPTAVITPLRQQPAGSVS